MANILALMNHVQAQGALGTARRERNALAQLGAAAASGAEPDYSAIAANGGNPLAFRDDARKQEDVLRESLGRDAAMLLAAPPEHREALYQQNLPKYRHFFQAAPSNYSPQLDPILEQLAGSARGPGGRVQSTYIDAQGNRVAIMADGTTTILGPNAPNVQIVQSADGYAGINKGTLRADPVTMGGAVPAAAPAPTVGAGIALDDNTLKSLLSAPQSDRAALLAAMQGGGEIFHPGANGEAVAGPSAGLQLQAPPKAPASESEESFSQPQEVKGPDGKPMLVQFGNRGTMRPVQGFGVADNAQSANKEQMQRERMVAQLSKRLADEQVPLVETQLSTIESALRPYQDAKGNVVKDIPGYGRLDSLVPDFASSTDAIDLRQQVQSLSNVILKSRSGAAVTDNELRRFLVEAGSGKLMPEAQLVKGIALMRRWFDRQKSNVRGGYAPDVVQAYYDNAPENVGLLDAAPAPAAAPKAPAASPSKYSHLWNR